MELFKRLPAEEHPALAKAARHVEFAAGTAIIHQGDEGNEFFVIKTGAAKVEVDGKEVARLKDGDFFGEM